MIELRVLGPPRIEASDGRHVGSVVHQSRRLALLAYLAAATPHGAQRRDKLLSLFWPDSDEARARAALSQALYALRSRFGDVFVSGGKDEVAIDPAAVWCDAAAFEDLLDAGRADEALALYRGDLLDGFHISDAPGFERWVDEQQLRLRRRAAEGAWSLAETRAADGTVIEAGQWARRAADLMPGDEAGARRLMLFFRGLGDRAAAIRAYEAFAWRLRQEYDLEPSAETDALAAAIRAEQRTVAAPPLAEVPTAPRAVIGHPFRTRGTRFGVGVAWPLVVLALTGTAMLAWKWGASRAPTPGPTSPWVSLLAVENAPPLSAGIRGNTIAFSRSGDIAYLGRGEEGRQLYLKRRNQTRFAAVPNTRGALEPFFSSDGEWIGYVADNALRKMRVSGGPSVEICRLTAPLHGVSWGEDGTIILALPDGLFRVHATGGEPTPVALSDSARPEWYRWPHMLPGGRTALFTIVSDSGFALAAVSLPSGQVRSLGVHGTDPHYVAPGYLVWARRNGSLLTAPFDARSLKLTGPALPVVEDVHVGMSGDAKLGASSEALLYVPFRPGNSLVLVDTLGRETAVPVSVSGFDSPYFSPDGQHILATLRFPDSRLADIWMVDLATNHLRRVTADSGSFGPVVSSTLPLRVAFASKPGGRQVGFGIRSRWLDSAAAAQPLRDPEVNQRPRGFTHDGRALVFQRLDPITLFDIWIAPLDGAGRAWPYLNDPASERAPSVSPNGRWMAWVSDRSGRDEVYVGEFPRLRHAVKISDDGGTEPRWARNGRALFYRGPGGMTRIDIVGESPLTLGPRRVLFDDAPYVASSNGAAYDVHPDGDRFAMLRPAAERGDLLLWHGRLDALRR